MPVAASTFTGVNLADIPAPAFVEALDFETILANRLASFQGFCTAAGIDYTAIFESDPAYKLLEVGAFQEVILRQRINDGAKACMVAYAQGPDLDNLAALVDVERLIITPANPVLGIAEVDEGDAALRQRTVLAPQGYSVAGPEGAYVFFAKSADPTVQDVSVSTPAPGQVLVTVLGPASSVGVPSAAALTNVTTALNAKSVRPLTDQVTVQAATILDYIFAATLTFLPGSDQSVVTANALAGLQAYQAANFNLGAAHTLAGLSASMFVTGLKNVAITSLAADMVPTLAQAAICTAVTLTPGGTES